MMFFTHRLSLTRHHMLVISEGKFKHQHLTRELDMNEQQLQEIHDRYIATDGTVTLPPEIVALVRVFDRPFYSSYRKEASNTRANAVVDFVAALAGVCVLLKDEEAARAALLAGFRLVNGANIIPERYGQYCGCVCDIAERIGGIANNLGQPEIATYVGPATMCTSSPPGYRPSVCGRPPIPDDVRQHAIWWSMKFQKE